MTDLTILRVVATCLLSACFFAGCGQSGDSARLGDDLSEDSEKPQPGDDYWTVLLKEADAEDRPWLEKAHPFIAAIAERRYADAFAQLSSHAKARMTRNQFVEAKDEQEFQQHDQAAFTQVSVEQFLELMKLVEDTFGPPETLTGAYVESLDRNVLRGDANPVDRMLAIGNISEMVPLDVRRASIRCEIACELTDEAVRQLAEEEDLTVAEIRESADEFQPYFKIKLVLVEDAGQTKVGYFEFLGPSMLD